MISNNNNSVISQAHSTLPSAYYGHGNANIPPTLLSLPIDVLNIITNKLAEQNATIPLRFVCKRIANLAAVKGERFSNSQMRNAAEMAIGGGFISLVRWYHDHLHYPLKKESSYIAARSGNVALLQWLCEKGCPWHAGACPGAAYGGHLEVLQWAHANGFPLQGSSLAGASGGNLALLQWVRANGCPWDEETCSYAAEGGHLAVLQWARANGCPWDEKTCANAAKGGHLAVLQWARTNGCPWDEGTCSAAAFGGHLAVLQWAYANGCRLYEGNGTYRSIYNSAQRHPHVIQWLREIRCPGETWLPSRISLL